MPEHPDNPATEPLPPRVPAAAAPPHDQPPTAAAAAWLRVALNTVEENLALDEALLDLAHEGLSTTICVRTWMAAAPTVVLGSSGRRDAEINLEACDRLGVRVIRRPSGGGTVLIGPGCLMWSVISPHPDGPPPIESIHATRLGPLAAALTAHLRALPAAAGGLTAGASVARRGTSDLAIVRNDAIAGRATPAGRAAEDEAAKKVSGNALRVRRHGVLYHGTLLDSFDLELVSRVLTHPPREPEYRGGRSHGTFLSNLGLGRETLERLVQTAFATTHTTDDWPGDRVARLVRDRYSAAAWTERL